MREFPLFNLTRGDLHLTALAAVGCASVALILRSEQHSPPSGHSSWRPTAIVFCSLLAVIFSLLTVLKAWFGRGDMCGSGGGEEEGYESLESGVPAARGVPFMHTVKPDFVPASRQPVGVLSARSLRKSGAGAGGYDRSAPSTARSFATPREDDDITCGIELEASKGEFEFNGVRHPAGTLRVVALEADGVCERQGACVVGDVLSTVDGKKVLGMHIQRVEGMLQGKAGTSIILGLYTDQSREPISRHVVLAPSPSAIGVSPRDSARKSGRL